MASYLRMELLLFLLLLFFNNHCHLLKLVTKTLIFLMFTSKNESMWGCAKIQFFLLISLAQLGFHVLTCVSSPFKWTTNFVKTIKINERTKPWKGAKTTKTDFNS